MDRVKVGGVLQGKGLAAIWVTGVPDRPGVAGEIFRVLSVRGINVEFIVHSTDQRSQGHVTFCVERKDLEESLSLLQRHREGIGFGEIAYRRDVGLVSVFGPHFRERRGIAATMFAALGRAEINILAISTSVSTVSCLVAEQQIPAAVEALARVFDIPGGGTGAGTPTGSAPG